MFKLTITIAMVMIVSIMSNAAIASWSVDAYLEAGNNALAAKESAKETEVVEREYHTVTELVWNDNHVPEFKVVYKAREDVNIPLWPAVVAFILTAMLIIGVVIAYKVGEANGHF